MQILMAALIAVLVFLQYLLWIAEDGVRQTYALRIAIQVQTQENAESNERNRALEADVKDLKNGLSAIEERARSEMGMIRRDETFYRILEQPPKPAAPSHDPTPASKPGTPGQKPVTATKPPVAIVQPPAATPKPSPQPDKPPAATVKPATAPPKPSPQPDKPPVATVKPAATTSPKAAAPAMPPTLSTKPHPPSKPSGQR
ncbi:MAG: cell division protein FtsB [Candidatus Competibacter sp.]|nr:cell division protein FtsB [Candidatus Competibacter sp.]